uniref:Uncharacterized protein n=1 Tax=Opuntia streptacantha TaxID=393608 RepID=A0A7C9ED85_OPUST
MLASPLTHACPHPCAHPFLHSRNCKLLLSSSALARYKPLKNPSLHLLLRRSCNGRRFNFRVSAETHVADSDTEPPHDALQPYSVKIPVGDRHICEKPWSSASSDFPVKTRTSHGDVMTEKPEKEAALLW